MYRQCFSIVLRHYSIDLIPISGIHWLITELKNEAMEAVKLAINLDCAEAQNAIAITAEQEHHSYAQLLRSAFQLSTLLQTDGGDTSGLNGHHDNGEEGFIGLSKVN